MADTRPPIVITPLETERLLLTPLDPEADADDLHEMYADPEVHAFGDTPPFERIEQTRDFVRKEVRENGGTSWAMRLRDDPTALGTIGIFSDQGTTIRGIGWSLQSSHWGRGITSEAAKAVVPFLLEQDGVDGLEAWVDPLNTRSLAVARNAGMVEAGRLPRTYPTRVGQSVVMVRPADPTGRGIDSVTPHLPVRDVPVTIAVFTEALGFAVGWALDDPPTRVLLSIARSGWRTRSPRRRTTLPRATPRQRSHSCYES